MTPELTYNSPLKWKKLKLLDYFFGPLVVHDYSDMSFKSEIVNILLGIFLISLQTSLFESFFNVKIGSAWIGVCCIILAIIDWRVYVRLLSSFALFAIALYGAINDGKDAVHYASISACASQHDVTSEVKYYGGKSNWNLAETCIKSAEVLVPDSCYCITK